LWEPRATGQPGVPVQQLGELGTLDDEIVQLRPDAGRVVVVGGEFVRAGVAEVERGVEGRVEEDRVALGREVERHDRRGLIRRGGAQWVIVRHDIAGPVDLRRAPEEPVAGLDEALIAGGRNESLRDHAVVGAAPAHAVRRVLLRQQGAVAPAVELDAQRVLLHDHLDPIGRTGRQREAGAGVDQAQHAQLARDGGITLVS
jgi:hypothetical protein